MHPEQRLGLVRDFQHLFRDHVFQFGQRLVQCTLDVHVLHEEFVRRVLFLRGTLGVSYVCVVLVSKDQETRVRTYILKYRVAQQEQ